jgi:hypothetical protein
MSRIIKFNWLVYDELLTVEQHSTLAKDRPEFENKLRKLFFFFFGGKE